jgi:hypothetical protein
MANETRLELIAEIAKRLQQQRTQDQDENEINELSDRGDFEFEQHIIKLNKD